MYSEKQLNSGRDSTPYIYKNNNTGTIIEFHKERMKKNTLEVLQTYSALHLLLSKKDLSFTDTNLGIKSPIILKILALDPNNFGICTRLGDIRAEFYTSHPPYIAGPTIDSVFDNYAPYGGAIEGFMNDLQNTVQSHLNNTINQQFGTTITLLPLHTVNTKYLEQKDSATILITDLGANITRLFEVQPTEWKKFYIGCVEQGIIDPMLFDTEK